MNLLQSAKREYYTIRQTLTEKNIIGKTVGVPGINNVSTASYLPTDQFEIQSVKVSKLSELTDVIQTSVKSLQSSFYSRTSTEAKLSSLIATEISIEDVSPNKNDEQQISREISSTKNTPDKESKSNTDSVKNSPEIISLETESNLLSEDLFFDNLLSKKQNCETIQTTSTQKNNNNNSISSTQIPTWLDEKRKLELQNIPDNQQNLLSKITLLKNSSLAKLLSLKSQTASERTRCHAMLHWMHDTSSNLNPEDSVQVEKFKCVQQEVRTQKLKFENRTEELVKQLEFVEKELNVFIEEDMGTGLGIHQGRFEPLGEGKTEINFEDVHQLCLEKSKVEKDH